MRNLQSSLYCIFFIVFIPILLTIISLFTGELGNGSNIIYTIVLGATIIAAYKFSAYLGRKCREKRFLFYAVIAIMAVLLLCIQIFNCIKNYYVPKKGDAEAVYTAIKEVVSYGMLTDSNMYFLRHPHQMFSMFFYSFINRIFVIMGVQSAVNLIPTTIVNCLMVTRGGILLSLSAKILTDEGYGLFTMFLFVLCNSYHGCVIYIYSHVLSVFFMCGTVFTFVCFQKAQNKIFKYILLLLSGIFFALSKNIEGVALIMFIAIFIYIIISSADIKSIFLHSAVLTLSFILTLTAISYIYDVFEILDYTNQENEQIPYTHWIMMGLSENGVFVEEDYQATVNTPTREEKLEMHFNEIERRISERSPTEMIQHLLKKEKIVWIGSLYGCGTPLIDNNSYNFAYRVCLILPIVLCTILSFIKSIIKRKIVVTFNAFNQIYITGVFLFYIIWEVFYTYLFSSFPIIILCMVLSIYQLRYEQVKD